MSKNKIRFVGMDVHADTIAIAVAEPEGEVRSLGSIPNRPEWIRKIMAKLGPADRIRQMLFTRSRANRLRSLLATDADGSRLRSHRAVADTAESRRPGEDRSAGCRKTGSLLPRRRTHRGLGSGCGARSAARSGAGARSSEERSASSSPPAGDFCCAMANVRRRRREPHGHMKYLNRIRIDVHFGEAALEATVEHYLHEVEHAGERIPEAGESY